VRLKAISISIFLLLAVSLQAQEIKRETKTIKAEGVERLVVEVEFGAGQFLIRPRAMDEAAILSIEYTPEYVRYDADYSVRGKTGFLYLESDHRNDWHDGDSENEWRLSLSTKYPTEIDLEIGACEAEFDFGGIPITDFQLDMGAVSGIIDFSEPNPERIKDMDIDIGASSLEIMNLANANFEHLSLSLGAASAEIDLSGEFKGESTIDIDVGVGSVELFLPRGLAVRIETDDNSWFSSVDFDDLDVDRIRSGVYESPDFDDASNRITIRIDVGMGSVDLYAGR